MTPDRVSYLQPRRSVRFQLLLVAGCVLFPVIVGWLLRASPQAVSIYAGFAVLGSVLVAAFWGGYVAGVAVIGLVYIFLPLAVAHKLQTDSSSIIRAILFVGISLLISWTAQVRRRSEAILKLANEDLENRVAVRTAELAATRDWLETTLASIGDAVIATNADAKITFMNPVAANLTGWREREAVGQTLDDVFTIVNEETRQPVLNPVRRALETGRMQGLANHTVLVSRTGREYAIDDSAAPIRDNSARITGVVLIFRDISSRRAAEREREKLLEEARAASAEAERRRSQIHSLFMQSPVIINIHRGRDHVFELVHPGMSAFLDCDAAVGRPAREAIPEQYRSFFVNSLDASFKAGKPQVLDDVKITTERGDAYYSFIHHPWRDLDGSTAGVMTLALDVTERVRARLETQSTQERLRETAKLESLGVLAGGIAHDFNNLLVGMLGNASLVLEMLDGDHPARDAVENLLKASERAAQLTHQMLAYSGKGRFFIEPLDLARAMNELLPLITPSISRSVRLSVNLPSTLPPIDADKAQMQQLLMNLVINAAEAYEGRPGVVTVSAGLCHVDEGAIRPLFGLSQLSPGEYVCLEVSDKGTGMSEETKSKIFDPFFTTKFAGRGLGLSAVLGIIRAHSGGIEVESEPGKGTTFRIYFPPSAVAAHVDELEPVAADLRGAGTILLVDDEETVRSTATSALESYGYKVIAAYDGESAINIFRRIREEVSLVVLDLTMPVLDGEAVLERLREINPDVRVILSSGFSASEATRRFEGKRLSGFLQKPYTAQSLALSVKNALGAGSSAQTA